MALRFRLAVSYVLFFGILLVVVGFAMQGLLSSIIDRESRDVLEEEYGSVKGYMRIENQRPIFSFESVASKACLKRWSMLLPVRKTLPRRSRSRLSAKTRAARRGALPPTQMLCADV